MAVKLPTSEGGVLYQKPDHIHFVKDMKKAKLKVRLYHGRFFWHGPAVEVENLQEVLSHTKVKCQWDHLGLRFIVYPIENDFRLDERQV